MEEERATLEKKYHFWESEVELVRKKTLAPDGKKFRYFDDKGIFNFVFMAWMSKWVKATAKDYFDPYRIHPLPLADQILKWQPIFSKHVSDGIASLEAFEYMGKDGRKKAPKPVKYILCRAIFLHKLLGLLSDKKFKLITLLSLAFSIIAIELFKEICMDHINYYVQRLSFIMDSAVRLTVFQHGLCYRRGNFTNLHSREDYCKSIIHGCSREEVCADNPLLCPVRRYKNSDVTPKIYALTLNDPFYISLFVECISGFIEFLTAFIYGIILMSSQFNVKALTILIMSLSFVVCMVVVEITNGFLMRYYLGIRDHKIARANEVIVSSLKLVETMSLDDTGHNTITETRDDELLLVIIRFFLSLLSKVIFTAITCLDVIILVTDFVSQVKDATNVESIDPSGLLASIFVIMKILGPLYMVPIHLRLMLFGINAFKRVEAFLRTCSPNFYLQDNKFTGNATLPEIGPGKDKSIPKGLMVMFKQASFAWVNSRKDLLDNTGTTCLRDLDFVLNTGDLAIITGAQGSGKSNFIKAILGDMTLVEGSMAALPLSTNMPIFYASQDVWLQKGTIRANITFGHRFDEDIYKTVIKTVELEHDISTWEGGDMRKISEHGYSLSGGQRVRVGLARAIYAYLIFSKVTRESESEHSFLVVLDDCFTSLDPFVARTIFKNLFENGKGLLAKGDVSTVLTISRNMLDACVASEDPESFPDAALYTVRNETLVHENMLSSFIKNEVGNLEPPTLSDERVGLHAMPSKLRRMCSSDDYARGGRKEIIKAKYADSQTLQAARNIIGCRNQENKNFRTIHVFFRAAGWPIMFFFILTFTFASLGNVQFVIMSKLSDAVVKYKKEVNEATISFSELEMYCTKALRWILVISTLVMIGAFFRIVAMTQASFNVSRRIHEYCIDSVFTNNSAVLKIKKVLTSVHTFLYMDTLTIDIMLNYCMHDVCLLLIEAGAHLLMLLFMMPWSTPIAVILCFIILRYFLYYFVKSCRSLQYTRVEAFDKINDTIESAISGALDHVFTFGTHS